MSVSAAQAAVFYREVAESLRLWTIQDAKGFPTSGGAQPFWSSLSRTNAILSKVPTYAAFTPVEISWSDFCNRWAPGLERDGLAVGVNWSGARATGYNVEPAAVVANVNFYLARSSREPIH